MTTEVPHRLHLGCGLTAPEGWLNVDGSLQVVLARRPWLKRLLVFTGILPPKQAAIPWRPSVVRLDLTRPLPYPTGSFSAVYSSHLLEHLYHDQALALLKECHRVLRPGSVCRVVVPDLEALVGDYSKAKAAGDVNAASRLMESMLMHDKGPKRGLLGHFYRITAFHQHKWMYDAASLMQMFTDAGFRSVRQASCMESAIAGVVEVENPERIVAGQGIVVEGVKET